MDKLKLSSRWKHLIRQGASIAKEGLDQLNRQVNQFAGKTQTAQENCTHLLLDDSVFVFYCIRLPCRNHRMCHLIQSQTMDNFFKIKASKSGISLKQIKVEISKYTELYLLLLQYDCYYRFIVKSTEAKNFRDYVWFDISDDDCLVPLFRSVITMKILCLDKVSQCHCKVHQKHKYTAKQLAASNYPLLYSTNGHSVHRINRECSVSTKEANATLPGDDSPPLETEKSIPSQYYSIQEESATEDDLKQELDNWAFNEDGTFKDIRTLLSNLSSVLWENTQWKIVPMSKLVLSTKEQLKKIYRAAILVTHPDKHRTSPSSVQYRAHRIFQALNEAYKILKESSNES